GWALAVDRECKEVDVERRRDPRRHERRRLAPRVAELLEQKLREGGVERMTGREQHGILVLRPLAVLLVEGELAVGLLRATKPANGGEPFVARRRRHPLD